MPHHRTPSPARRSLLIQSLSAAGLATLGAALPLREAAAVKRCVAANQPGLRFCEAGIPSDIVGQAALPQHFSQWCWAACISMVFAYYRFPVSQERIVRETFGAIVDMPASPDQILRAVNRDWDDDKGRRFRSIGRPLQVDATLAAAHLAREEPLIIGSLGHATVLTAMGWYEAADGGVQLASVTVRDPAFGGQRRQFTGQEAVLAFFLAHVGVQQGPG